MDATNIADGFVRISDPEEADLLHNAGLLYYWPGMTGSYWRMDADDQELESHRWRRDTPDKGTDKPSRHAYLLKGGDFAVRLEQ